MSPSSDPSPPNWLAPAGPAAGEIAAVTWVVLIGGAVIYLAVLGLLGWAVWRPRRAAGLDARDRAGRWLVGVGTVVTVVLVTLLLVPSLKTLAVVLPPERPAAVTIEVTGHQW
jgi:cytochrome c oxidase subunit 2